MDIADSLVYAVKNMGNRSLRSWLTITGLVVGVIAIVVILSVSEGFNQEINSQLSAFSPDTIIVYPSANAISTLGSSGGGVARAPTTGKLLQKDVDSIESIPGVKSVSRILFGRSSLAYKGDNITGTVFAMDRKGFDQFAGYIDIETGRLYNDGEKGVVVLGADAATQTFGKKQLSVGSVLTINGHDFRVVGVLKRIGTAFSSHDDKAIYVSYDEGKELFADQYLPNEVALVYLQIDPGYDPKQIKSIIEQKLASNHHVRMDELDFSVITAAQVYEIVSSVLTAVELVLGGVTLIASVVGAIGIANTMFMNVLERTGEIGILKSVGATRNDILKVFLIESAIIGFAGGVIGLAIGFILLQIMHDYFAIPVFLRLRIIAFVFIFSIGTGLLAGLIPSLRASKLDPIEALRYD